MAGSNKYEVIVEVHGDLSNLKKEISAYGKTAKIKVDSSQVKQAAKDVGFLGVKWADATKKFLAWKIIGDAFSGVERGITQMITSVYELDTALTEFNKVTDLSEAQLDKFIDKAYKAGESTAKTGREIIEASTEFAKSGFSADDSLALAKYATMYQNIADEEISAGEAAGFIVSQIKAFNMEAKDAEKIISAVNEVSNNYAVSSADLANNLGKVSATMAASGTSYEQTLGMMTAITEVTRTAGKSANALKTISQRIRGVGEDGEDASKVTGDLQKKFDELGISIQIVNKETGDMESTYNIMTAIAGKWEGFNDSQRQELGELAAGKNRITEFNALMSNFGVAISATETALNSAGSAEKENAIVLESMKGKLQELRSAFENFSRNTINGDFLKSMVSALTAIVKFSDSGIGRALIQITAFSMAVKGIQLIEATTKFQKLASTLSATYKGTTMLNGSFKALWGVITANPIGIVIVAFTSLTGAMNSYNQKLEENKRIAIENTSATTEQMSILESLKNQYIAIIDSTDSESKKNEALVAWKKQLVEQYGFEKDSIDKVNLSRQTGLELIDKEREKELSRWQTENAEEYGKAVHSITEEAKVTNSWFDTVWINSKKISTQIVVAEEDMGSLQKTAESLGLTMENVGSFGDNSFRVNLTSDTKDLIEQRDVLSKMINDLSKKTDKTISESNALEKLNTIYVNVNKSVEDNIDLYRSGNYNMAESILLTNNINSETAKSVSEYEDLKTKVSGLTDSQSIELELLSKLESMYPQFNDSVQDSTNNGIVPQTISINELSAKMSILSDAQKEMSDSGYISIETYKNLLSVGDEYLALLFNEDGSIKDVTKATYDLQAAKIDELAISKVRSVLDTASAYVSEGKELSDLAIKTDSASDANWDFVESTLAEIEASGQSTVALRSQIDAIQGWATAAKAGIGKDKPSSSGSSRSSAKSTTDAWKEEFEYFYKELQYLRDMDIISEEVYYARLSSLNKKYFSDKSKYLDEYRKYEVEIHKWRSKKSEDAIREDEQREKRASERRKKRLQEERDALERQKTQMEKTVAYVTSVVDKQIDALEKEKEALEKVNDERENAIKLQELENALAIAKTKQVRVYREGQGFVYEQDLQAVSEVQKEINEFKAERAHQAELDRIDEKIKGWEDYKKKWQDVVNNYETEQDKLIAEQILGAGAESDILDQRIDTLQIFADKYLEILQRLADSAKVPDLPEYDDDHGGGSSSRPEKPDKPTKPNKPTKPSSPSKYESVTVKKSATHFTTGEKMQPFVPGGNYTVMQVGNGKVLIGLKGVPTGWVSTSDIVGYSKGTNNAIKGSPIKLNENGLEAIVTPEGTVTSLPSSGYGVIPNPITEKLTNFANNPSEFLSNLIKTPKFVRNEGVSSQSDTFNINGNINVNSNDANDFLSSIKSLAIQRSSVRK